MSLTPSTMLPLGTPAPDFNLLDTVSQKKLSLDNLKSDKATVIIFMCNHCPYVKHILPALVDVAKEYDQKGIKFIAINSNDIESYPEDAPEKMRELAKKMHFSFPYLFDETQEIAKAYQAACTPDFYVFDENLDCVYRGRFDDASPGKPNAVTGRDLTTALDAVLNGRAVDTNQHASIGCNIKWRD
jgi:thiol-disulfide isomerase/thioredoxin